MEQLDLALIGYEPAGSENLSLRLLAGAVADAGYSVDLFLARGFDESQAMARDALRARPRAIGLSAPDTETALHGLALAQLMRRRGYAGCIVCGGPFATLQPEWILERATAVDCVVRHDGELPLVRLLAALRGRGELRDVPSLTNRERANPPLPRADGPRWRPLRGARPEVMGVPTAALIGGRGCMHRCDYCTHAAQASLVLRECREAGVSAQELRRAGIGRPRRRPLGDLVDEMSELYHRDGVRYFQLVDESFVPSDERRALHLADELHGLFDRHRMGPVALGFMTRGDALTAPVADALSAIGLVRTLVGVESGVSRTLDALGRRGDVACGRRGVRRLAERGVVTLFNALLLHPECSVRSIREELAFLRTVRGALFDTVQVRPFPRTALHRRLGDARRLVGGDLLPGFAFADPALPRFQSALSRLQTQVLGRYTPTFRAHDLTLSAVLAARFGTVPAAKRLVGELRRLGDRINLARVDALEALLDACERGDAVDREIACSAEVFAGIDDELDRLEQVLTRSGNGLRLSRHYRNLAAAAAFVFAVTGAPACQHVGTIDGGDPPVDESSTDTDVDVDSDSDADTDADECQFSCVSPAVCEAVGGSAVDETPCPDDSDVCCDWSPDTDTGSDADTDTDTDTCPDEDYWDDVHALEWLVQDNCDFWDHEADVLLHLDENGEVIDVEIQGGQGETEGWQEVLAECYLDLLAGEEFPCLAGEQIWIYGVTGGIPE